MLGDLAGDAARAPEADDVPVRMSAGAVAVQEPRLHPPRPAQEDTRGDAARQQDDDDDRLEHREEQEEDEAEHDDQDEADREAVAV